MTLWCLVPPCIGNYSSLVQNGERSITCLWFCGSEASPEVQCWLKVRSSTRKGQAVCVFKPHPQQGRKGCQENWGSDCSRDESSHVSGALSYTPFMTCLDSGVCNNSNINSQNVAKMYLSPKCTLTCPSGEVINIKKNLVSVEVLSGNMVKTSTCGSFFPNFG